MTGDGKLPRQRGYSLIELMIAIVLFTTLGGTLHATAVRSYKANFLARDYANDVLGLKRALGALERDLRGGAAAEWRLRGAVLERTEAGRTVPYAWNVARFEVARDGALARVTLELGKRSGEAERVPLVVTAVRTPEAAHDEGGPR